MQTMLGVIGGSGVYQIDGLEGASWVKVKSPFGKPSDEVLVGRLSGLPVAFLPRHGRGHVHDPATVPYRANIDALKRLGCTDLIAVSAVGSLREDFAPGDFVIVDQYIDRTSQRPMSFFGPGCVAHVSLAHPTCPRLGALCATAARDEGLTIHQGATYLSMEGPQFSTLAESRLYRSWGADVIGMTGVSEARLAREAELCYASVAMVTDYDCWHPEHDAVTVADIIRNLHHNAENAQKVVQKAVELLSTGERSCPCASALEFALITDKSKVPAETRTKLELLVGKYFAE